MVKYKIIFAIIVVALMIASAPISVKTKATITNLHTNNLNGLGSRIGMESISNKVETPIKVPTQSSSENYTEVNWNRYHDEWQDNWNYKSIDWLFGPRLEFKVFDYATMTRITSKSTIDYNEEILFQIKIPKSLIEPGSNLTNAIIRMSNNKVNESGYLEYDVYIELNYLWD